MSTKVSAARKARYSAYEGSGTAAKNKSARAARHTKSHPNDVQSAKRVKPSSAGVSHIKSKLSKSVRKAVAHDMMFNQDVGTRTKDRDVAGIKKSIYKTI